jgi:adenylate kinase family enzyme
VKQEGFLYDNNSEERRRATIIAKRQADWWEFIKDSSEEYEEKAIRSIIAYSNQNEYSAKIRSAKDFHEKWKKVANSMKQSVKPVESRTF